MFFFASACYRSPQARWERLSSDVRLQLERGDLDSALNEADQGFRDSANVDKVWNWKFRVLKAESLLWKTRNGEVLELLAIPPPQQLSGGEFAVRAKAIEAMALGFLRHDADAEAHLKEADDLASRTASHMRCQVLLFEGIYAFKRARYIAAEQVLRESRQLAQHYQQPFVEESALINLGVTSTRMGRFDEAIEWLLSALRLAQTHQYRLQEYLAVANLAWSYQELGDLDNSISYFSQEDKVLDQLGQEKLKEDVLANLGAAYFADRNYTRARESYLKAFAIAQEMQRKKNTDEKRNMVGQLSSVAAIALEEGKLEEAEEYSQQASAIDANVPKALLVSAKIAAAHNNFNAAQSLLAEISKMKDATDLDRLDAEAELAKLYVLEHQNARAERQFQKLIFGVEATRSHLRVDENRLAFSFHAGRYYDDYVDFLMDTGQQRKAFQVGEFSRSRTLAKGVGTKAALDPKNISIEQIQGFLARNKEILLAYWLAPKKSFLWVISSSKVKWFSLASGDQIERKAREYNRILATDKDDSQREGEALYDILVVPAQKLIPTGAHLVIIPDGQLDRVNFEALRVPGANPHYWIEDVETEIASSASILLNSRRAEREHGRKLLLIGNPVEASSDYPALKHAAEEMEKVKGHFSPNQEAVFSQDAASPAVYPSTHPDQFDLIHFVTHGTAHELRPLESAIILSPDKSRSFKLYARDIVSIPINAEIVTISGCYGAGKRAYSGEGLVGLAWAFLKAGAHQVLAGLWDVDDRASVDLMDDFYTGLQKGLSASSALRSAKLKMVRSENGYNRPYYWAPLQVYTGS